MTIVGQMDRSDQVNYRVLDGRIDYVTDGVGLRGTEVFRISVHGDGSRLLRACCEMHDEVLVRDVFLSVDANFAPSNAHVHLMVEGRFVGTGHYLFGPDELYFQGQQSGAGVIAEQLPLQRAAPSFGSHSVQNDAWAYGAFDHQRGAEQECTLQGIPVTSKLPNGADGPAVLMDEHRHRFLGEEVVTTAAGRFDCRHYQFLFDDWPAIDYWVHGPDYLLVKCRWDLLHPTYELVELEER